MIQRQKLYLSRLLRVIVCCSLPAMGAIAQAQYSDSNLIPSVGGRPELLTVLDMRKDEDQADRVLAKSAQGLMNADALRTDKIYLILNDQDQRWLDWLVKRQYVLSSASMHDMEELIRRWPSREALLCDAAAPHTAAAVAACEGLLLVTDERLVGKLHLTVRKDMRGQWKSDSDAQTWLFDHYGDQLNKHIVGLNPNGARGTDLLDYAIANKMFTFSLAPDGGDNQTLSLLAAKFPPNIPCLAVGDGNLQSQADAINRTAKFIIPASGISNLSVWTTFSRYRVGGDEQNSGAAAQPRALYQNPGGLAEGNWLSPDSRQAKTRMPWLRELAPPIYESFVRGRNGRIDLARDTFRMGVVRDDIYGEAYGSDRARIWTNYLEISRNALDLASRNN